MGAWGPGNFENDGALDWVAELLEGGDDTTIRAAFGSVLGSDEGDVDVDDAAAALAAAEAVAAINGHPGGELPEELASRLRALRLAPADERTQLAVRAVERVAARSELQELWEESGPSEEWRSVVRDLLSRLAATPRSSSRGAGRRVKKRGKRQVSVREVANDPSPDGAWVLSVTEVDQPEGASTHVALSHAGGGAGVWAAMGTELGVSARWLDARELELHVPRGVAELQRKARIQHYDDVVTVTYRER